MSDKIKILAFAGSLRKNSYNKMLLNAAIELKPENIEIEIIDIKDIPLYNGDVEEVGIPEAVSKFKEKAKNADGVLIATPEYNHAISGVLKNAIDWASRPPYNPFSEKPVGIMGATMGISGTISSQESFRHIGAILNMHILNTPMVLVSTAQNKFDENGKLTDVETRKIIGNFLEAFSNWTKKFK
jgi:chromate reductase, NAD(P)H dehydrogenase (quinone)